MNGTNSLSDNQEFPSACNARAINHHFALSLVCTPQCRKLQLPPCIDLHSKRDRETPRVRVFAARISMERNVTVKGPKCLVVARAFAGKWIDILRACLWGNVEGAYSILPSYIDNGNRLGWNKRPLNPRDGEPPQ